MERDRRGILYRRLLAGFFIAMFFCTVISRIYDSVTVPKVTTNSVKRGTVEKVIDGTGTIKEKQTEFTDVAAGLKVRSVPVIQGSVVKAGDTLFTYQLSSLLDKKEEIGRELEKLELDMETQRVSAEVYPNVTQSELSAFEVQIAEREAAEGRQDYEKAYGDYTANLEKLKKDYERKMVLTEDELWEKQNSDYEAKRKELAKSRRSRDSEVRTATRLVDDLEAKIGKLEEEGNHDEEIKQLERELERARVDLDDLIDSWNREVEDTEAELDTIDDRRNRIENGDTSSLDALKETYETAVKQQEDILKKAETEFKSLQKALEKARFGAANAARTDENTRLTNNQKKRVSDLTRKGTRLDIEAKKKELSRLEELIGLEGIVTSKMDGTIVKQELLPGKVTTGEELLSIATGALQFEGSFIKDDQEMAVGDSLSITIPGTSRKMETKVARLNLLGEKEGIFQADIEELQSSLGAITDYECKKQSDIFNQVIPLNALRKDMKGYFCLVVRSKPAILGEEFKAERVDLQLLYEGSKDAAVDGPLLQEDRIIVNSNKVIGEGDRVRMVSEL